MEVTKRENNLHFLSYVSLIIIFLLETFFFCPLKAFLKNKNHFTKKIIPIGLAAKYKDSRALCTCRAYGVVGQTGKQ